MNTSLPDDRNDYEQLQRFMLELLQELGSEAINLPAYQKAWEASEEIKNRNGGMPPNKV